MGPPPKTPKDPFRVGRGACLYGFWPFGAPEPQNGAPGRSRSFRPPARSPGIHLSRRPQKGGSYSPCSLLVAPRIPRFTALNRPFLGPPRANLRHSSGKGHPRFLEITPQNGQIHRSSGGGCSVIGVYRGYLGVKMLTDPLFSPFAAFFLIVRPYRSPNRLFVPPK